MHTPEGTLERGNSLSPIGESFRDVSDLPRGQDECDLAERWVNVSWTFLKKFRFEAGDFLYIIEALIVGKVCPIMDMHATCLNVNDSKYLNNKIFRVWNDAIISVFTLWLVT